MIVNTIRRRPKYPSISSDGIVIYPSSKFKQGDKIVVLPLEEFLDLTRQYRNQRTRILFLQKQVSKLLNTVSRIVMSFKRSTRL